jgi:hypothetical protein
MPDIAKCINEKCTLKEKCYRWTSKPSEYQQAYHKFECAPDMLMSLLSGYRMQIPYTGEEINHNPGAVRRRL